MGKKYERRPAHTVFTWLGTKTLKPLSCEMSVTATSGCLYAEVVLPKGWQPKHVMSHCRNKKTGGGFQSPRSVPFSHLLQDNTVAAVEFQPGHR